MELLLEMKVKQRGLTSDALIYAQHIMLAIKPTSKQDIQAIGDFPRSTAGREVSQYLPVLLNVIHTPSDSGTGSVSTVERRNSVFAGQGLLCTLLSPGSDSSGRPFATRPTHLKSPSSSESSAERQFLDNLKSELMERRRQRFGPVIDLNSPSIEESQRRFGPVTELWYT